MLTRNNGTLSGLEIKFVAQGNTCDLVLDISRFDEEAYKLEHPSWGQDEVDVLRWCDEQLRDVEQHILRKLGDEHDADHGL